MAKRCISREQLDYLPSELHKIVAQELINRGDWVVVEHFKHHTSGDCEKVTA